jgi:hypothetical protein
MGKMKIVSSTNIADKKKRHYKDYFDIQHNPVMTPNHRSIPKDKKLFHNNKINLKTTKKDGNAQKRLSQGKLGTKK